MTKLPGPIRLAKRVLRPIKELVLWLLERRAFAIRRHRARRANAGKEFILANDWVILCVKRTAYAKLIRDNVNSLHIGNPTHRVTVLCDQICEPALRALHFDYPQQVTIINRFVNDDRPWQFLKIAALGEAAQNNAILLDADTMWWADPVLPATGIVFQVVNRRYADWPQEALMLEDLLGGAARPDFNHYVTGFIRLPANYWTDVIQTEIVALAGRIWTYSGNIAIGQAELAGLRRLCEEIAVGYVCQRHYAGQITTLKTEDPYNDRSVMQSLYYGAINRVQ